MLNELNLCSYLSGEPTSHELAQNDQHIMSRTVNLIFRRHLRIYVHRLRNGIQDWSVTYCLEVL